MIRQIFVLTILLYITLQVIGDPIIISPRLLQTCSGTDRKYICRDCHTLQLCNGGTPNFVSCAAQYPGRPYCYTSPDGVNNTCVAAPTTCKWTEFNCPGVGYFPNLQNCKSYYACSKTGTDGAVVRYCMYNSVFNVGERACRTNTPCYLPTADCAGQQKLIPYKPNNRFYVICQGTQPPALGECPLYSVFNSVTLDCEFKCFAEGNFPHPNDPKKYIICISNGKTIVRIDEDCGEDEVFNPDKAICVSIGNSGGSNTAPPPPPTNPWDPNG